MLKTIRHKLNLIPLEENEQIALFDRAKYYPLIIDHLIAIPNGGLRNKIVAKKLKSQGVKSGVSDIFFAYPTFGYHGLWIELKRRNAKNSAVSKSQLDWLQKMMTRRYMVKVARGADEAWKFIQEYLNGRCFYDEYLTIEN